MKVWAMRRLKELLGKVNQHVLVIVEGSIPLQYSCLQAAGMSLGMELSCSPGSACCGWDIGGGAGLRSAKTYRSSEAFGSPSVSPKPPPLLLSPRQTHMVTHALGTV